MDASAIWTELEGVLAARLDMSQVRLRPPADAAAIARAETTFGARFPQTFVESLAVHEGQDVSGAEVIGDWRIYPLEDMVRVWQRFIAMREEGIIEWNRRWVPIATDGNGNHLILDLDAGRIAEVPRIVEDPKTIAADFLSWLETIARDIDAGVYDENLATFSD
jgi:cell wall assembly regulator SMI1